MIQINNDSRCPSFVDNLAEVRTTWTNEEGVDFTVDEKFRYYSCVHMVPKTSNEDIEVIDLLRIRRE